MRKPLVNLLCSFLLILFFALGAAAQDLQNCGLEAAPPLLGLKLGMSAAQARAAFGRDLKVKVKDKGDRTFFQNYTSKKAPARLAGITALYLRFLDGSLYQIEVFYAERADLPTLEAFTANLSAAMSLPAETSWRFARNRALIDCAAFSIVADKPVDARVELTDKIKLAEAEARRKQKN